MSTVLLFGATGSLGRQVELLLSGDPRVTRLLRPGRAELDLFAATAAGVAALLRAARPAIVLNCAGRMSGGQDELLRGNAGGTAVLLDAIAAEVPKARYVRLGSAAEYGPGEPGRSQREDDPARPVSAYGISHLAGTLLVERSPVDGVSLRVFNLAGPGVSAGGVLGRAADLMRTTAGPIEMGPLGAYRDFVDVRDVAGAVVRAAFAPELTARVLNVGSGHAVPVREAVALLAAANGHTAPVRESEPEHSRSKAVGWSRADTTLIEACLGWRPAFSLADSVKAMTSP